MVICILLLLWKKSICNFSMKSIQMILHSIFYLALICIMAGMPTRAKEYLLQSRNSSWDSWVPCCSRIICFPVLFFYFCTSVMLVINFHILKINFMFFNMLTKDQILIWLIFIELYSRLFVLVQA